MKPEPTLQLGVVLPVYVVTIIPSFGHNCASTPLVQGKQVRKVQGERNKV